MGTPSWIQDSEKVVAENHPTLDDVANRPAKTLHANAIVDHNADGTHEKLTVGSDADGDMYYRAASVLARLTKGAANLKMFMNAAGAAPEWAKGMSVVHYTRDSTLASGSVAYTGAGFKPGAVLIFGRLAGNVNPCIAFSDFTSYAGMANYTASNWFYDISTWVFNVGTSTNHQRFTITSADADGLTVLWTKVGTPTALISFSILYLR